MSFSIIHSERLGNNVRLDVCEKSLSDGSLVYSVTATDLDQYPNACMVMEARDLAAATDLLEALTTKTVEISFTPTNRLP